MLRPFSGNSGNQMNQQQFTAMQNKIEELTKLNHELIAKLAEKEEKNGFVDGTGMLDGEFWAEYDRGMKEFDMKMPYLMDPAFKKDAFWGAVHGIETGSKSKTN